MKTHETKGRINRLSGRLMEAVGVVTGNERLEREGAALLLALTHLGSGRRY